MRNLAAALITMLACTSAYAANDNGDLVVHTGVYSMPRDTTPSSQSITAGIEYRFTPSDTLYGLRPAAGVLGNGDGAMYGYGGFAYDVPWKGIEPFVITPGVYAGIYGQGDSKKLGSWFEFRESLELDYRFDSGHRLGASISHLSNAGIGSINPGTETVEVVYSMPLH